MRSISNTSRLAVASLLLALLSGCVSIRSTGGYSDPGLGAASGVAVRVYADDDARRAHAPSPRFVLTELQRLEEGEWRGVYRSLEPEWRVADLQPGRYRLRIPALLDEAGNTVEVAHSGDEITIAAGEIQQLEVTLEHVSKGWVVAGAVAAGVLLYELLDDLGGHEVDAVDALVHVALDLALWRMHERQLDPPPAVTSHFPAAGDVVAARQVQVVFALSEYVDELDPDAITVVSERAGRLYGTAFYDDELGIIVWQPEGDLPRNDVIYVTLEPDAVRDQAGHGLPFAVEFTFSTTY